MTEYVNVRGTQWRRYLYVRCNYTHLEEFAAEVIQTGAIPDDRYKRRDVRYYPECGMIEFSTFSSGFGSETVYEGFYYSDEDVPFGFQGTSMSFQSDGGGWSWHESDGDNFEYTEKILGKWYWYRMHFWKAGLHRKYERITIWQYISGTSASGAAVLPDDLPSDQSKGRF